MTRQLQMPKKMCSAHAVVTTVPRIGPHEEWRLNTDQMTVIAKVCRKRRLTATTTLMTTALKNAIIQLGQVRKLTAIIILMILTLAALVTILTRMEWILGLLSHRWTGHRTLKDLPGRYKPFL